MPNTQTPARADAPPSRLLLWLESRALLELGALSLMWPWLRLAPRGDGHPVLVLPGLGGDDSSTLPLRAFLRERGYDAQGWGLGPNRGPRPGVEPAMQRCLDALFERHGRSVSLIGISLGGILARELARRNAARVRGVITLGSPFAGAPRASHAWRLYESLSGLGVEAWPDRERMAQPPPVPSTAIYSRSDGVVAWQGCLEQPGSATENIEVRGSHCGLGHNAAALHVIADRLSQPEGRWRRFADRAAAARPCAGFSPWPASPQGQR